MQTWAQVFTRVRTGRVTIKTTDRGCDLRCEWRHAPEAWAGIWEKTVSWVPASEEEGWLSLARWSLAAGVEHGWRSADGKVSIERLCHSPYVEKPLDSKVIKSFVPVPRGCKCFLCFGIPMSSICALWTLWTFYAYFTYLYHGYVTKGVTVSNAFYCQSLR